MFSFLNSAMTNACQRYLSVAIGKNDAEFAQKVFSASLLSHIVLIGIVLLLGESRQFWIMTGDNDKKAGIYRADCDFLRVEPINIGEQRYRAVVAFPYKDGIIYATDSVENENHLYVCESDNDYVARQLFPINGSCIYGTETKDYYVFSTTVEPPEGRGIRALFSNKLGGGIKSRDVHLVTVAKRDLSDIRIVAKYRKDWLPMKLFQYGAVMFPSGQYRNEDLLIFPVACKGVDGESIRITL